MAAGQGGGVVLGYLKYVMGLDSLAFQEGLGDADKRLKAAQKSLKKTSDKFADMGAKLSLALTAPLVGFAAKGINEARETAAAMAQVNAAITSMGNAAGISSDQLVKMADKLELSSLYEGDQILQKVTANLLTFGNVAGENFARAQQAAVDLSTRMGTDLQASTLLIGKALNDPVKGMNALARAGIQLTASQKEQIKAFTETGQAAKAQAIILGELERQFGGAAAAAQNVDPFNKLNDAFNQMAEKVGTSLLPLLPPLGEALISILDAFGSLSPETQKWVLIVGGAAAVLGPFAIAISAVASGFGVMLPLLAKIVPLFYATGVAGTAGATGLTALGVAVATIGGPLIAGAAAIAVLLKYKEPIDKFGLEVVASIKKMVLGVTNWLGGALKAAFNLVMAPIEAARKAFFNLYDAVVGHSYIPDMVDEIGQNMGRLDQLMVDPAQKAT
ncbi:MAG: phage tail length tape measure family protein, partial [Sphingobium sp.]